MEEDSKPDAEVIPLNAIRVDTAFPRYPIHRLAKKGIVDISIREGDPKSETRWEVDYSKKHGQPGPQAYKIDTLIINRRIEEARRPLTRLLRLGSLSDICRELSLSDSGKNRADVKRSLFQNAFAGITAKTRYRHSDGSERTLEAAFTRYDVILTGEELPDGRKADAVFIVLHDVFMQVINGAMTRPLDYDYLKSLPPAAQRFYELLSYQIYAALKYDRTRAKLTYSELCSHAPQTRHVEWERVRSQMNKVHRPHKESGYISDVKFHETVDREGKPDWFMHYMPGPKAKAEFDTFNRRGGPSVLEIETSDPLTSLPAPLNEAQDELRRRGITASAAADIATRHSEEKILFQIECLDWQVAKHPEKIGEPAAYLIAAIENDYAAPKRFRLEGRTATAAGHQAGQAEARRRATPPQTRRSRAGTRASRQGDRLPKIVAARSACPAGTACHRPGQRGDAA